MSVVGHAAVVRMYWEHPRTHTAWRASALTAVCAGLFAPDTVEDAGIDECWRRAQRNNPAIFDGPILHVCGFDADAGLITTAHASYRCIVALRAGLDCGIRALGVSGMVRCGEHILVARRGRDVLLYPSRWELAPSGVAEPPAGEDGGTVDLVGILLNELVEETGLHASRTAVHPMMFAYDATTRSYDACFVLDVDRQEPVTGNGEYAHLAWQPLAELRRDTDRFIPVSRLMLGCM
ncbi:MAG: NUDIX hydrolase [Phycisphaerales bacterium]|nr:NUDIX hydrolase [Phycisphaerales bacterium]